MSYPKTERPFSGTHEEKQALLESVKKATQRVIANNKAVTSEEVLKAYRSGVDADITNDNPNTAEITAAVKSARENNVSLAEIATAVRTSLEGLMNQIPTAENAIHHQSGWSATEIKKKIGGLGWGDSVFPTK